MYTLKDQVKNNGQLEIVFGKFLEVERLWEKKRISGGNLKGLFRGG